MTSTPAREAPRSPQEKALLAYIAGIPGGLDIEIVHQRRGTRLVRETTPLARRLVRETTITRGGDVTTTPTRRQQAEEDLVLRTPHQPGGSAVPTGGPANQGPPAPEAGAPQKGAPLP